MCLNQLFNNKPVMVKSSKYKQQGLGLPSALFLIVVISLLLATMTQLNDVNNSAYARQWLSLRAFYLAESGAQISAVQALNSEQVMSTCDNTFIQNQTYAAQGWADCLLNVRCESQVVSSQTFYTFTSEASCGNDLDRANRIIQIRMRP